MLPEVAGQAQAESHWMLLLVIQVPPLLQGGGSSSQADAVLSALLQEAFSCMASLQSVMIATPHGLGRGTGEHTNTVSHHSSTAARLQQPYLLHLQPACCTMLH